MAYFISEDNYILDDSKIAYNFGFSMLKWSADNHLVIRVGSDERSSEIEIISSGQIVCFRSIAEKTIFAAQLHNDIYLPNISDSDMLRLEKGSLVDVKKGRIPPYEMEAVRFGNIRIPTVSEFLLYGNLAVV